MGKQKRIKRIFLILIVTTIAGIIAFNVYVSDYYHRGLSAKHILELGDNLTIKDDWIEMETSSSIGFIFYPGAKVEYTSYLPLMKELQEEGVNCYLVEMPYNLAFFGMNKAEEIMANNPDIETWYIGGHSLGGAIASSYAGENADKVTGVVLLGAYLYGDYPVEQTITIYGSEDELLNRSKITYEKNVYELDGGNHAQFGDYGEQDGDGFATISEDEQIEQTIELVVDFMMFDGKENANDA